MAKKQNDQNVEYRFTGDISSLKNATEGAIKLLDQYQSKIKSLIRESSYTSNKGVAKSMQNAISDTVKEITKLQQKFKAVQDLKLFKGSPEAAQLASVMRNLQTQLDNFNSKSKVTVQDVRSLTSAMKDAKKNFHDLGPAVDNLAGKEQRFQMILDSVRQKSEEVAQRMRDAFGKIPQPFDSVSSKLESFKAKAAEALDHVKRLAEAAGSGFKRVFSSEGEDASGVEKLANYLRNLASRMLGVSQAADKKTSSIKKETDETNEDAQSTNKFVLALQILAKVARTVGTAVTNGVRNFRNFRNTLSNLIPQANQVTNSLRSLAQLISGLRLGDILSNATKEAIGFIENLNLFTVAMGDARDEAFAFVDAMSEIYGMDTSNLYRYAGYFNQLTDAIGMSTQASKTISLSLTKAANDIASLFNVNIEQVVNNLASGMQGMSMAVRKYGIDIRKTTLAQTALTYGFKENVSTTSEANRQALRYLTIMQQVKNATKQVTTTVDGSTSVMGDFARNIETPANQLRILKEQASQVARAFGNFFIPIMQKTLYVVNGVLMAIKLLLQFLAALAGIDVSSFGGEISSAAGEASGAVGDIGDEADKSAKKLKNLIAPFDELTILTEPKDTSGKDKNGIGSDALDPALAAAIEAMSLGLDEVRMKAMDVRDKILELLGLEFDGSEITVTVGGFVDDLIHLWDDADYTGFGARISEFINQGVAWGIEHTNPAIYAPILNEKIAILGQILNGLVQGFDWTGLGTIIGNGITIALGMLNTFLTTFDFTALGAAFGNCLNGIVDSVNWNLLGETIGNYFMAEVNKLSGFLNTFNWVNLGHSLATGFMSLLNTIQWGEMGSNLASGFNNIIDGLRSFWATYEWGTLGTKLAQFLSTSFKEINWHNLGVTISSTIRALFKEAINFVGQLDWFSIGKAVSEFVLAIDWFGLLTDVLVAVITVLGAVVRALLGVIVGIFTGIGKDVADGFQNGILDGLKNIRDWLKEHLVDPVVSAVKGFLGIHSPSTVFSEIGRNLIQGFKNGITQALGNIAAWIQTNIVNPIVNTVKSGLGIVGAVSTTFQTIGSGVVSGLMNGLNTASAQLSTWGSNIRGTVQSVLSGISSSVSNTVSSVTNAANNIINKARSAASQVTSSLESAATASNKATNSTSTVVKKATASTSGIRMATGGVVRGPTQALIGEGRYDEAVIPLGNSPELQEMIDKIATAVTSNNSSNATNQIPVEVHVYLESTEITSYQNRTNRMYGRTQQNV